MPSVPDDGTLATYENITKLTLTIQNQVQDMHHSPPPAARSNHGSGIYATGYRQISRQPPACIFSPTAPQVENYVDTTGSTPVLSCIYVPPRVETASLRRLGHGRRDTEPHLIIVQNKTIFFSEMPIFFPRIQEVSSSAFSFGIPPCLSSLFAGALRAVPIR